MPDPFGGARVQVKPPERGIFPLDHEGECKIKMRDYLKCLNNNKQDHFPCKKLSRAYLQCRMDRDLMAKDDLDTLGLGEDASTSSYTRVTPKNDEGKEIIAGLGVRPSNKGFFK